MGIFLRIKKKNYVMKVRKMSRTETTYNKFLKSVFYMANPIKKSIMKTSCVMHMQINIYAIEILKRDEYRDQFDFFHRYISEMEQCGQIKILKAHTISIALIKIKVYTEEKVLWI